MICPKKVYNKLFGSGFTKHVVETTKAERSQKTSIKTLKVTLIDSPFEKVLNF